MEIHPTPQPKRNLKSYLKCRYKALVVIFFMPLPVLSIVACGKKLSPEEQAETTRLEVKIETSKYLDSISQPLTEQEYPNLYQDWGHEWMQNINTMLPLAAERVNSQVDCDRVSSITLSPTSEVRFRPILLLTCDNNEKFYVSLKDVLKKKTLLPNSKLFGKQPLEFIDKCLESIKPDLLYPEDVVVDDTYTRFRYNNSRVELLLPFKVKTGYDTTTTLTAKCTADASFNMDFEMVGTTVDTTKAQ